MTRPHTVILDNAIPVYVFNLGDQPVSRVDVIIEGGRCDGDGQTVSELLSAILREGSATMSAREIAEKLDFYGAWLGSNASAHNITLSLYAVNRHFDDALPIFAEIIQSPAFPSFELQNLKSLATNRLKTNNEKVAYISSEMFSNLYFGEGHNLGKPSTEQTIDGITVQQLKDFHKHWFTAGNVKIIISGAVSDNMLQAVNRYFGGGWQCGESKESRTDRPSHAFRPQTEIADKPHALQSAVRIGMPAILRTDPHYIPLRILTTALGGYFGSRLMTNIREDKGYTYGITSALFGYRNNSFISISCQCDTSYTWRVIEEIKHEMEKLRQECIPDNELRRLRSYMLSDLARSLDTPFSIADYYASTINNRISENYFDKQVEAINSITPGCLQNMAQRYLDCSNLLVAVAGDKKVLELQKS